MVREAEEENARVLKDVEESAELVKAAREETSRRVEEVWFCLTIQNPGSLTSTFLIGRL